MVFYFVQRGETLYAIAKRYQTTVHAIVAANRLEDPNSICPGQALIIPRPGEVPSPPPGGIVHLVRPGETIFHLAAKFGTTAHEILRANQIAHPEFILPGQQLVIPERHDIGEDWPMHGRTSSRVGASPIVLNGAPAQGWSCIPRKQAGVVPSAPVVRYDRVYVALGDGQFYSLDRYTGRVKWRFPAGTAPALNRIGSQPLAAPAIFDGLAYLCSADGVVHAVDAYTGQSVWKVDTGEAITSSPAVADGVLYVGGWDGFLYAVEAKTGAIVWRKDLGAPILLPVAVADEQVFATAEDSKLWALEAHTGETGWITSLKAPQAPVFAELVLLAGEQAFDPKTGHLLWEVDAGGNPPVARLDQVIYPGGVVDLFTGTLRGASPSEGSRAVPVAAEGPADEAETGGGGPDLSDRGATVIPSPVAPVYAIAASATVLLGVGAEATLLAWELEGCTSVWRVPLDAPSVQPPAIAQGQIYLTLTDGSLRTYRFSPAE